MTLLHSSFIGTKSVGMESVRIEWCYSAIPIPAIETPVVVLIFCC